MITIGYNFEMLSWRISDDDKFYAAAKNFPDKMTRGAFNFEKNVIIVSINLYF
jgi:hypothetical protein